MAPPSGQAARNPSEGATDAQLTPGLPLPPDLVTWVLGVGFLIAGGLLLAAAAVGAMGPAQAMGIVFGIILLLFGIPFVHDASRPDAKTWVSLLPSKHTGGFGTGPHSGMGRNASNRAIIEIQGLPPAAVSRLLQTYYPSLSKKSPQKRITATQLIGSVQSSMSPDQRAEARRRLEPLRADPYEDVRRAATVTLERLDAVTGTAAPAAPGGAVHISIGGSGSPPMTNLLQSADTAPWRLAVLTKSGEIEQANLRDLSPDLAGSILRTAAKSAANPAPAQRLFAVRVYGQMGLGVNAEARASAIGPLEALSADRDRKVRKAAAAALAKVRSGVVPAAGGPGSVDGPRDALPVAQVAPDDDKPPMA